MSKLVLTMFLCLSLQACSNGTGSDKDGALAKIGNKAEEKKPEKNGLLAIGEFMAVMAVLKTQVE
ncbi:hypothetical protein FR932_00325 [Moritella marina ATCC 15381]|uniref:Uncharacterized protein n=1 Tax=Moritella marina ATCC 15381 TaxID=1202962 RepID=A0A5J6WET7_MORMI|nr:hypothetical protein [Moritella marina]QFI36369.1 hypothetical protein FR932_00325 [Moritella marina ATCC 15381]